MLLDFFFLFNLTIGLDSFIGGNKSKNTFSNPGFGFEEEKSDYQSMHGPITVQYLP